jgi:hypothetical protein
VTRALALAAALVALAAAPAAATRQLAVTVDRTRASTRLGRTVELHSTIVNRGSAPAAGLIAHLNVLSLRSGVYVDPEDWSSHRTRYLAPIPARGSTTLTWRIKAVNAGSIGVYVAVLPASGGRVQPTTGPMLRIAIADRRALATGGLVPLALGVPAALLVLLLAVRARRVRE